MTTFVPFTPGPNTPFTFQPILDGQSYNCRVTNNLFGQRWFVECYDGSGNLVFYEPIIETASGLSIGGLSYNPASLWVTVTTVDPHGFFIGQTVSMVIVGAVPTAYNGAYEMMVTGPSTLQYMSQSGDPGDSISSYGSLNFLISICGGYFTSTMCYRNGQFEISP
jgi:hypothetical protein